MDEVKFSVVRRVTQDNRGKNSSGVDGVSKLKPSERYKLATKLKLDGKSQGIKRVMIPKPGTIMLNDIRNTNYT